MKRLLSIVVVVLAFGVNASFAGLFPSVNKPDSPDASMIAMQFSVDEKGELIAFMNSNASMWAPVVKMEDGSIVEFRWFTGGVDMTAIYYKENLVAGKYTLIGFQHVYTDYGKLAEAEKAKGSSIIPDKNPYENEPYHIKQLFELDNPIEFALEPNKIMTLGHYAIKYKYKEGLSGTSDDRWKVREDETKIMMTDSEDQSLLNYMKPWATKKWKMWNAKNPAK